MAIRPAVAGDDGTWTLVETAGAVHIEKQGFRPVALTTGDEIGPGQRILTEADGRAVLRRGKNTIAVSPNSALEVPGDSRGGMMTRIRHMLGTLLFKVEKPSEQHFEVITPDVAVVVKGTTFTTSVGAQGAVVHVISGLVQVTDIRSGQAVFVRPGNTAVAPKGGGRVDIQGSPSEAPGPNNANGQSPDAPGQDRADTSKGKGPGKAQGKGKGVKIASAISGNDQSIGAASGGLLRREGVPGNRNGRAGRIGNQPGGGLTSVTNPGGNVPQGIAKGITGATPPGLTGAAGNSGFGQNQGGGNPNPGGGPPAGVGGGNPNAGGNNGNGNGNN